MAPVDSVAGPRSPAAPPVPTSRVDDLLGAVRAERFDDGLKILNDFDTMLRADPDAVNREELKQLLGAMPEVVAAAEKADKKAWWEIVLSILALGIPLIVDALRKEDHEQLEALGEDVRARLHGILPDADTIDPGYKGPTQPVTTPGVEIPAPVTGRPSATVPTAAQIGVNAETGMPAINGRAPGTWPELGDTLYQIAAHVDRSTGVHAVSEMDLASRAALVNHLESVIDGTAFEGPASDAMSADLVTQMRSSSATLLRAVIGSVADDRSPEGRALLERAVLLADKQVKAEPHKALRESMAFGLARYQDKLPAALKTQVAATISEVAPVSMPYDQWLADGKISVDLVLGDSAGYRVSSVERTLRSAGFTEDTEAASGGVRVFRATLGEGDEAVPAVVRLRIKSGDNIFEQVGKDGVDIVAYSGHSSYGRNMPKSLKNADDTGGTDQLLFIETCFGKDNLHQMHQEFPAAQIMTTFNSATTSGDFAAGLKAIFKGIGNRSNWDAVNRDIGDWRGKNLVTPTEIMERRRYLDRDQDGRADIFDRLFDVNLQRANQDLRRGFEPMDPGAPPHQTQALYGVVAANWCNRGAGAYNEAIKELNGKSQVWCAGFYAGGDDAPPVRFSATTLEDGTKGWKMEINDRFAHMPEEIMRVVATHEFNLHLAATEDGYDYEGDRLRTNVNSLMAVAFTLSHDLYSNDTAVWRSFLRSYGFPDDLSLHDVERYCEMNGASDRDVHGGSRTNIDAFIDNLPRAARTALSKETAGRWQRSAG